MIAGIGLLASLGSTITMIVFLFWQAKRAASSADGELAATKRSADLDLALAARGRAVEDRDRVIDTLKAESTRLEAALTEIVAQRDHLVASMNPKDSHAAVDALRDALTPHPTKLPPVSVVPPAATPGAAPHR